MTKNAVAVRKLIKTILNNNVVDPYPGTRIGGTHFYDDNDGFNLNRANSFPKGFVTNKGNPKTKSGFGSTGYAEHMATIEIWYFIKHGTSYTDGDSIKYEKRDYVNYMVKQITDILYANITIGSGYHIKSIGESEGAKEQKSDKGFLLYYDVVPIVINWSEQY